MRRNASEDRNLHQHRCDSQIPHNTANTNTNSAGIWAGASRL
jgi:hypothetical protein